MDTATSQVQIPNYPVWLYFHPSMAKLASAVADRCAQLSAHWEDVHQGNKSPAGSRLVTGDLKVNMASSINQACVWKDIANCVMFVYVC